MAFRVFPEPKGTIYYYSDLIDKEKVEQLFDYCQILEANIFKEGWELLITYHGFKTLFEINEKSGWFDCENLDEYKLYVESYLADISKSK
ncbi:hypothetical protein [Paenibacillus sp. DMB20]|uniref:hypothetical protein n=1 Tax=Paenibacillus sp. DMB20 TaxID=1642570 RepID=UPI0006279DE4|nr:hypothetical protein [Paenibacillus sp. DMB20]KKO54659.1 hypothetical protein XI25_05510 [Paenibacillus sp. DMB20]